MLAILVRARELWRCSRSCTTKDVVSANQFSWNRLLVRLNVEGSVADALLIFQPLNGSPKTHTLSLCVVHCSLHRHKPCPHHDHLARFAAKRLALLAQKD